jgi:hypothetical protein
LAILTITVSDDKYLLLRTGAAALQQSSTCIYGGRIHGGQLVLCMIGK